MNDTLDDLWPTFARDFSGEALEFIEYSFGRDPSRVGTMVVGRSSTFYERVMRFGKCWPDWPLWNSTIESLHYVAEPSAYLFKVDWINDAAHAVTLYFRHGQYVDHRALSRAFDSHLSYLWKGPSPANLGELLGQQGPVITGVRLLPQAIVSLASYFYILGLSRNELAAALERLSEEVGIPARRRGWLETALARFLLCAHLECVGIGYPAQELKLYFSGVTVEDFIAFIAATDSEPSRADQLGAVARCLNQTRLSWFGVKVSPTVNCDWKAYFAFSERAGA